MLSMNLLIHLLLFWTLLTCHESLQVSKIAASITTTTPTSTVPTNTVSELNSLTTLLESSSSSSSYSVKSRPSFPSVGVVYFFLGKSKNEKKFPLNENQMNPCTNVTFPCESLDLIFSHIYSFQEMNQTANHTFVIYILSQKDKMTSLVQNHTFHVNSTFYVPSHTLIHILPIDLSSETMTSFDPRENIVNDMSLLPTIYNASFVFSSNSSGLIIENVRFQYSEKSVFSSISNQYCYNHTLNLMNIEFIEISSWFQFPQCFGCNLKFENISLISITGMDANLLDAVSHMESIIWKNIIIFESSMTRNIINYGIQFNKVQSIELIDFKLYSRNGFLIIQDGEIVEVKKGLICAKLEVKNTNLLTLKNVKVHYLNSRILVFRTRQFKVLNSYIEDSKVDIECERLPVHVLFSESSFNTKIISHISINRCQTMNAIQPVALFRNCLFTNDIRTTSMVSRYNIIINSLDNIYSSSDSTVCFEGCRFFNMTNTALYIPVIGAILELSNTQSVTVKNSTFQSIVNYRSIYSENTDVNIINCKISDSKASIQHFGGAIYFTGAVFTSVRLNIRDSIFHNIECLNDGGAIFVHRGHVNFKSCNFSNCRAHGNGGCVAIHTVGDSIFDRRFQFLKFMNCLSEKNGGALAIISIGTSQSQRYYETYGISDCWFYDSKSHGPEGGGAIYTSVEDVTFSNLHVENCVSTSNGGAMYVTSNIEHRQKTISNSVFVRNLAHKYGGAVFVRIQNRRSRSRFQDMTFNGNIARIGGGCFVLYDNFKEADGDEIIPLFQNISMNMNEAPIGSNGLIPSFVIKSNMNREFFNPYLKDASIQPVPDLFVVQPTFINWDFQTVKDIDIIFKSSTNNLISSHFPNHSFKIHCVPFPDNIALDQMETRNITDLKYDQVIQNDGTAAYRLKPLQISSNLKYRKLKLKISIQNLEIVLPYENRELNIQLEAHCSLLESEVLDEKFVPHCVDRSQFIVVIVIVILFTGCCLVVALLFVIVIRLRKILRKTKHDLVNSRKMEHILDLDTPLLDHTPQLKINKDLFQIDFSEFSDIKMIGGGGSGAQVYKARWKSQFVAVKLFQVTDLSEDHIDISDFERELNIMIAIRHERIVTFYGACMKSTYYGIVYEFCPHGSLSHFITTRSLSLEEKIALLIDVAVALSFIHSKRIIHRDLKLDNILIDEMGRAKLCDFGVAKMLSNTSDMTLSIGTNAYLAPEVVNNKHYNEKCDIFSFAIIMYCLLFEVKNPYYYTQKKDATNYSDLNIELRVAADPNFRPILETRNLVHIEHPFQSISSLSSSSISDQKDKEIEGKYIDLMKKCWSHDPSDRPCASQVVTMLQEILEDKNTIRMAWSQLSSSVNSFTNQLE